MGGTSTTHPSTGLFWKWPVAELWIGRWLWTHLKQTMCWTFNMYIYIYTCPLNNKELWSNINESLGEGMFQANNFQLAQTRQNHWNLFEPSMQVWHPSICLGICKEAQTTECPSSTCPKHRLHLLLSDHFLLCVWLWPVWSGAWKLSAWKIWEGSQKLASHSSHWAVGFWATLIGACFVLPMVRSAK